MSYAPGWDVAGRLGARTIGNIGDTKAGPLPHQFSSIAIARDGDTVTRIDCCRVGQLGGICGGSAESGPSHRSECRSFKRRFRDNQRNGRDSTCRDGRRNIGFVCDINGKHFCGLVRGVAGNRKMVVKGSAFQRAKQ